MKLAVTAVLAICITLTTEAVLAEECDKLTAAKLNGETGELLQRLDLLPDITAADLDLVEGLKQRFAETSELHTRAIDQNNKDDLNVACESYRVIYDEAKAMAE